MRNIEYARDAVDVPLFSFAVTEVNCEFRFNPVAAEIYGPPFGCSARRANCGGRPLG
jgi:hypothetical protein